MAGLWCFHRNQRFLVFSLLFLSFLKHSIAIEEFLLTCGGSIDLITNTRIYSGVLKVDMPTDFSLYQGKFTEEYNCDININFESGINLQIELYYLDIMPVSSDMSQCSTGLEVFERNSREVYGGRLCREGWRWEKEHREKKQEKKIIKDSPLTFRLKSDGPYKGTGFKVHFNKFRTSLPCNGHREFRCERQQRCVHDDITCDGWDDCGDDSDESEDAGCELFTVCEIFAIIIGVFLVIGTVVVLLVFLLKYRKVMKTNRLQRKESKLALEEERRSMREPSIVFPHRFNSMESVNKSHYSRSQRMDVESLMDRMELEKTDKYSCKDNMSERSYKSVNRRNRMTSQASLAKEKTGAVGRSNQDLDKDVSDKYSDKKESGRNGREDDRESEKRRKESKYSDEEYDSEEERRRRRRRRSRDRRRYDRSDDEDYDSDSDRRRRKSRDRDRYDSDEENDSDRDRRRRRRRRYDSDEDYDSDSERRRRRRSRRRYDSDDDYDSDSDRKRRSRKNLDEEENNDNNDDDRESSNRRRRRRRYDSDEDYDSDRDRRRRRRHDSDEYDSDRDRRRRRSRDRRSRDLSEEKIDKDQVRPVQSSLENNEKSQEPNVKQLVPEKQYQNTQPPQQQQQPGRERKNIDPERHSPHPYQHQPSEPVKEKQPEKLQKPEDNNFSPPPRLEDTHRYNRRTPRSNGVSPSVPPNQPTSENAWVPRSERKRNRRSRGDLAQNGNENAQDIYEDVVPKIQLENLGFREESV